jgi:hypothetical protein
MLWSKQGCTHFQKSTSHLKILNVREVTWRKFHADDPRPLAATEQNLVATSNWCTEFVNPWIRTPPPPPPKAMGNVQNTSRLSERYVTYYGKFKVGEEDGNKGKYVAVSQHHTVQICQKHSRGSAFVCEFRISVQM